MSIYVSIYIYINVSPEKREAVNSNEHLIYVVGFQGLDLDHVATVESKLPAGRAMVNQPPKRISNMGKIQFDAEDPIHRISSVSLEKKMIQRYPMWEPTPP